MLAIVLSTSAPRFVKVDLLHSQCRAVHQQPGEVELSAPVLLPRVIRLRRHVGRQTPSLVTWGQHLAQVSSWNNITDKKLHCAIFFLDTLLLIEVFDVRQCVRDCRLNKRGVCALESCLFTKLIFCLFLFLYSPLFKFQNYFLHRKMKLLCTCWDNQFINSAFIFDESIESHL